MKDPLRVKKVVTFMFSIGDNADSDSDIEINAHEEEVARESAEKSKFFAE